MPSLFKLQSINFSVKSHKYISKRPSRHDKLKVFLSLSITGAICVNGLYTIASRDVGALETNFCYMFVISLFLIVVSIFPTILDPDPFVAMLNGVRQFRDKKTNFTLVPNNLRKNWDLLHKISMILSIVYDIGAPMALIGLTLLEPSLPPFLGSIIQSSDIKMGVMTRFGRFLIISVQSLSFISLAVSFSFQFVITFFVSLHCVAEGVAFMKRLCSEPIMDMDRMTSMLQVYHHLQILVGQTNTCFRKVVLPSFLLLFVWINILATTINVSLGPKLLDHLGNCIFPFSSALTTVSILLLGTFAGLVNKWSTQCGTKFAKQWPLLIHIDGKVTRQRRDWMSRKVKSCSPMKIKFGNNFMEITTPLVLQALCTKSTIRLILLH
ncbi:hypothetical protein Fcan01_27412 [Folsomia candida]|uniref:Uncharacterized protein n=1 Tax=Folsomia candida TaxID=158441 RepID=A0A226CWQ3_FOLCA|nr:hypothetical protein Fcan01_27412 [Folsomia candida]